MLAIMAPRPVEEMLSARHWRGLLMSPVIACWVAVGSALGGVARYWCSGLAANWFGETFPWGTLIVNVTGSFLIGVIATLTSPDGRLMVSPEARQFMMVGIMGGFTTFSSFSLQTLRLAQDGDWLRAGLNVIGSVAACLIMVRAGHVMAALLNR